MVQENINRLLWDRRIIVFPDDLEAPDDIEYVILRDLTLEDRNLYLVIRDLETRRARKTGVPTEGELLEQARGINYWGEEEETIEAKADDHIAFLESEFVAKKKFRSRQNIIKAQIQDAEEKRDWVRAKRNNFRINSAEYLGHEIGSFGMLRRVAMLPDNSPVFPDEQKFLHYKQEYPQFVYMLLNEMMSEGPLDVPTLREMARSTEWRLIWTLSRENLPMVFNRPIGDLTLNQRMLIYWSRVYDSAFETHEPPDREIIEDDDLFDSWLADRDLDRKSDASEDKMNEHQERGQVLDGEYSETCTCGAKAKNKGKYLGEKMSHTVECPFGTWHRFTPEEREAHASRVYGRNSKRVRQLLDSEQESVLRQGLVEEQDLRSKKTRQLLGMKTKVIPIKR